MIPLFIIFIAGLHVPIAYAAGYFSEQASDREQIAEHGHKGSEPEAAEGKETPPAAFAILDLFSEALEASFAGIGVKVSELKPKVEHIQELYQSGEDHKAFAEILGISTEVVLLGFFIETFGVGEMFISALSFSGNWFIQLTQSVGGILISSKAATAIGDKVKEAVEEKYEHKDEHKATHH